MPSRGTLFIIAAPSGAGKTSLVSALLDSEQRLKVSVSHTTRPQRPGEENGVDYYFVDQTEFDQMVQDNQFLEQATVFGNSYGTSREALEEKLQASFDVILEIDWQGAQQIKDVMADCISIFILPPSLESLQQRLKDRAQDDASIIEHRMQKAKSEISHCHEFDYLIVNDNFDEAFSDLQNIFRCQRLTRRRQQHKHQNLINKLLS